MVKNDSAFQIGSRKFWAASRTSRAEKRELSSGLDAQKYHRRASAPVSGMTSIGSTTLPRRFDILRPFSSLTWPRQCSSCRPPSRIAASRGHGGCRTSPSSDLQPRQMKVGRELETPCRSTQGCRRGSDAGQKASIPNRTRHRSLPRPAPSCRRRKPCTAR